MIMNHIFGIRHFFFRKEAECRKKLATAQLSKSFALSLSLSPSLPLFISLFEYILSHKCLIVTF